jgi:TBC domain-containing protein kinase-like protein
MISVYFYRCPKYLAPEVLCQGPVCLTELCPRSDEPRRVIQPPSGPKVDVWALGLILIEAYLVGKCMCNINCTNM